MNYELWHNMNYEHDILSNQLQKNFQILQICFKKKNIVFTEFPQKIIFFILSHKKRIQLIWTRIYETTFLMLLHRDTWMWEKGRLYHMKESSFCFRKD